MENDFSSLFDEWSKTYDDTVRGADNEYRDVFLHYDAILEEVASRTGQSVLEFGVGTGNLSQKLLDQKKRVYGVEPSKEMRVIAQQKVPDLHVEKGHFLHFDVPTGQIDSIISTYAFHHLTNNEKARAIGCFREVLDIKGNIIFADTMFVDESAYQQAIELAKTKGYHRLAEDLQEEFYTTIPVLRDMFEQYHFDVTFKQKNAFVWIVEAVKGEFS